MIHQKKLQADPVTGALEKVNLPDNSTSSYQTLNGDLLDIATLAGTTTVTSASNGI